MRARQTIWEHLELYPGDSTRLEAILEVLLDVRDLLADGYRKHGTLGEMERRALDDARAMGEG